MRWGQVSRLNSRTVLMAGVAASMLWAAPAVAQERQRYSIPAGDAAQTVQRLAVQSGVQVMVPDADLSGIKTNSVNGNYTPVEALRRMLAGKGLEVVQNANGAVVIRRAAERPQASAGAETTGEDIIVTGSRIQRAGFDTLQSAMVEDSKQIEKRGYVNVAEALEANPLFGTSDSSAVGGNQSINGTGQRFVNMFSLGSQRTLTLVNGRRFVSANSAAASGNASAGSQVDLNLIPAGLVDRVETIAIGGAPIYGSDAIAGTVNIILKDNFDGLQISGLAGINEDGDSRQYAIRGLAGTNFSEGRGNIVVGLEYTRQSGLLYRDRFGGFKNAVANPDNVNSSDGISALTVVDDYRYAIFNEGGLPYFDSGAGDLLGADGPGVSLPPFGIAPNGNYIFDGQGRPLQFGPNGDLIPFNVGTVVEDLLAGSGLGTFPLATSGGDGFSLADNTSLLTPTYRVLGNMLAHYDITPDIRVFFEGAYAHSKVVRLSDLTSLAAPGLIGGPKLTFSVDNPFLSDQARSILQANGLTTFNLNRNLNDIVQRKPQQTVQNLYRFVGGVEGKFDVAGERWNWDVSYNYGRVRNNSQVNYINPERFLAAINAVEGPGGSIVCGGAAPAGCVPINLFGYGSPSDEAAEYVSEMGRSKSTNTQTVLTANLGGKLPFGISSEHIAFNIGVERRVEKAIFEPDAVLQAGDRLLGDGIGAYSPVAGKFGTKEVYGELVVPLVSADQNFPLIRSAEFDGSIRYVDHSLAGGALTWSAGGRISPKLGGIGEGLTFRGVYTRAIRSPAVSELFTATSPVTNTLTDPCGNNNFDRGNNPDVRTANCAAALAAVGAPAPGVFDPTTDNRSVSGTVSGNPALDNEKAKSWSLGLVYQPPAIPGFRFAADWTDVRLTGGIENLDINSLMASCYDSAEYPTTTACSAFRRLTAQDIASGNGTGGAARTPGDIAGGFNTGFVNTSTLHFAGLIVAADYNLDISGIAPSSDGRNSMRFGTKLFYTDTFEQVLFDGQPITQAAGTVGLPKWRVQGNIGATLGEVDLDVQILWRDKTKFSLIQTIEDTPVNDVGSYTLVNGTIGFNVDDRFRLQLIVNNIFDRDIPYAAIVRRAFGSFDFLGRSYMVTASATF
ncbi:TonB-dependent receptor domain-containing protein [Sphingopyxis panaciterrae]